MLEVMPYAFILGPPPPRSQRIACRYRIAVEPVPVLHQRGLASGVADARHELMELVCLDENGQGLPAVAVSDECQEVGPRCDLQTLQHLLMTDLEGALVEGRLDTHS